MICLECGIGKLYANGCGNELSCENEKCMAVWDLTWNKKGERR